MLSTLLSTPICQISALSCSPKVSFITLTVVSWLAYLLAVGTGCESLLITLSVMFSKPVSTVSPFLLMVLIVLSVLVYRARGNVARILRMD
ncbi:phage holin family protein [Pseudomonas weihenstephanensis]|nr:phage holin family protein [Pseudomonas weihenstephanensis]